MRPGILAAVAIGGAAGTLARAGLADLVDEAGSWPWPTFAANVAGAFVLGWVAAYLPREAPERAALGAGLCGALTTFSTFALEALTMVDDGAGGRAALYVTSSVVLGLAAAVAGGRLAIGRRRP